MNEYFDVPEPNSPTKERAINEFSRFFGSMLIELRRHDLTKRIQPKSIAEQSEAHIIRSSLWRIK